MAQAPIARKTVAFRAPCFEGSRLQPALPVPPTKRYPEQGFICSQVISRRAHFSRRESSTCVLVAGPSEQLIEDAKDQSAHHRKDARRQRRFAHHAVYLQ